jgi:predicted nucleotidyltransferase
MRRTRPTSIISPVQDELNQDLFESLQLKPKVRKYLLRLAVQVARKYDLDIKYVWMIGSNTGFQYEKTSDIDININVHNKINPDDLLAINKDINKRFNEKRSIKSHPITFKVLNKPFKRSSNESSYDLKRNHWIKKPHKLEQKEVNRLIKSCIDDELLKELVSEYKNMSNLVAQFESPDMNRSEIAEKIANSMDAFVAVFDSIKERRREAFIKGESHIVNQTCANIVFKLAESYGFYNVYKMIRHMDDN